MTAWVLALTLAAAGDELEEERLQLQERLAAEKATFDALSSERQGALDVLDALERLARESSERAAHLERTLARVKRQTAEAQAEVDQAQGALQAQQARLRPRLLTLYRLQRQDALGVLLASQDFAVLLRRQRALKTLVGADLAALEDLAVLAQWHRLRQHRLERLEASARGSLTALRVEHAVGQARQTRFRELLSTVTAEQNRMSRVIAELEASERELTAMVKDLQSTGVSSGMRARRGHLPFPTKGLVEVSFGKVVNPRFNTVTVQKGLDIRAAAGAEVASVASGTVVFAGWLKGYGNLVIIDHGASYHSLYAHLARFEVEVGTVVEEGESIGQVGDTGSLKGAFLYFEIRKAGQAVDPRPWLEGE
jgi:murein DD-endopeptidase MepM/ murein hydrolase activator NlpD